MATTSAYIVLHDTTVDGSRHKVKALVAPHRVTIRMDEINAVRGTHRIDVVTLTPEAMDALVTEWQQIRTPKEVE